MIWDIVLSSDGVTSLCFRIYYSTCVVCLVFDFLLLRICYVKVIQKACVEGFLLFDITHSDDENGKILGHLPTQQCFAVNANKFSLLIIWSPPITSAFCKKLNLKIIWLSINMLHFQLEWWENMATAPQIWHEWNNLWNNFMTIDINLLF